MKKRLSGAGLALAGIAALAGCSVNPGAAAVVGDTTISEAEVSAYAEQASGTVQWRGQIVEALAAQAQQEQTQDALAEQWKAFLAEHAPDMDDATRAKAYEGCSRTEKVTEKSPEAVRLWCEMDYLLTQKPELAGKAPAAANVDLNIEISPRYGDYFGGESLLPAYATVDERGA